jgi:flagellar biosynthesis protein FliR
MTAESGPITALLLDELRVRGVGTIPACGRILGLFLTIPVFSSRLIPISLRLALVGLLALGLPAVLRLDNVLPTSVGSAGATVDPLRFALVLGSELLIGVCLGWYVLLLAAAVRGAAVFISEQTGFSLGGVLDPLQGGDEPALRTLHALFAVFLFLSLDIHHLVLRGFVESYQVLPAGFLFDVGLPAVLGKGLIFAAARLFEVTVFLAFPVTVLLLLVTLVQGVLMRVVPELEFFVFAFPLRAIVGIGLTALSMPLLSRALESLYRRGIEDGWSLVKSATGT